MIVLMRKNLKDLLLIFALTVIPTFLIWTPFFLRLKSFWTIPLPQNGMATLVSNYDGPLYIIIAKTFYNANLINNFAVNLNYEYYAAHFPLFPVVIRIFSYLMGYPYAMLFSTLLGSFFSLFFFYKLAKNYTNEKNAMWLTTIFSIFPARWLVVRSVGSPEPFFIAFLLASIYFFNKKKYLLAGIFGALTQLTKSPGILLFFAYLLFITIPNLKEILTSKFLSWFKNNEIKNKLPIFFIPASLLLLFTFYSFAYKNFFAYFNSGDNIHIFFPPFTIFNYSAPWVGTFWLEEIIFIYLLGAISLFKFIKNEKGIVSWFFGIFFFSILFVSHRDLLRYSLPLIPFSIISFRDTLIQKEFKYIIIFLAIPIYLFSLAYISQNVMPIGNWAPFL
jgi:hypothetical protein